MSKTLWTYSPEEIHIVLGGVYSVEGYVPGSFVSITKDVMPFTSERASDGSLARVYHRSDDYSIILNVMACSPTNDFLTKLWQLDEITQKAKFPIYVKDALGTSFFHSTTTWVEKIPSLDFDDKGPTRQWTLKSAQGVMNIGGNEDPSNILQDIVNTVTSAFPTLEGII